MLAISSKAQIPNALNPGGAPNPGSLLTQLAGALKPGSFLSSWSGGGKANWLSAAGNVSDAVSMAKQASSLAGFIKPEMFKQGVNAGTIAKAANAVKTYSDASGVLKSLNGGLKPEAFVSSWASKQSSWKSALNLLK
jgi:hypothetical protein